MYQGWYLVIGIIYIYIYSSADKPSTCNVGDQVSIPGLGRAPGKRERLLTPVFWPGEFHEFYSPRGHKELDTTERLSLSFHMYKPNNNCLLFILFSQPRIPFPLLNLLLWYDAVMLR